MSERGARRGAGAPFYAPPRRKTSAEIISEARAAVYGGVDAEMSGSSSGGALRPLRTRRPYTPREPQRTLFTERSNNKDNRPPSAFDLKYLTLGDNEDNSPALGARISSIDEDHLMGALLTESHAQPKKKQTLRIQRSVQDRSNEAWGGFPKLPHLSGRSKPLHKRPTGSISHEELKAEADLTQAISIVRPLQPEHESTGSLSKSLSPEASNRRRHFAGSKSVSCDANSILGDVIIKHIGVPLPNSTSDYNRMSTLELAETLSSRSRDVEKTVLLLQAMQRTLETTSPAGSLRELVLKALYTHIDSADERVLVAIARAMLTLRVTGTNLAAACKLVFKIARNDKNDHFFKNTNLLELLVEGCGRADPVSEGECCVYGAGALRFLALEPRLCAQAHAAGALHLAALHLKILNNAKAENPRGISEQSTHALYQLTGALRNLAGGSERDVRAFVGSGALAELLSALAHHTDHDVLTNVARCLSVLSAQEACCEWLCAASGSPRALLRALAACAARAPLAVRLAYTLGNMAAANERARINIYNEEGGVDVLLTILESYTKRSDNEIRESDTDPDLHLVGTDLGGSDGSYEDVLIKTVRVVANLCLAERAGRGLATTHAERTIRALLACLELAKKPYDGIKKQTEKEELSMYQRHEELATACLATLNNVTFYRDPPDPPDPVDDALDQMCVATCGWVWGAGGAACEAVRALGNLSRAPRAAMRIVLHGALDALPPFLQHEDTSVRCAAAGVLVNVCGAGAGAGRGGGGVGDEEGGGEAARLAARALSAAAAAQDAPSAALLARALWNAHAHCPLSPTQAHQAAVALAMFINDESVFAECEVSRNSERRASNPELSGRNVKFAMDDNYEQMEHRPRYMKAYSLDQNLHVDVGGEDLGFEEGEEEAEGCTCGPCRRLAAWEQLVGVAVPLLEQLRPGRQDASVGTD